jgi:hypothetical protein
MNTPRSRSIVPIIAGSLLLFGCTEAAAPSAPDSRADVASSRAGLACVEVADGGDNRLGFIPAGFEGEGYLGGLPGAFTVGDIEGTLHSYITSGMPVPLGAKGGGATLITLRHVFNSPEGGFHTEDKAVCAPNPDGPGTCQLSDQMTVGGGTGVFANASGKWHNTGTLDFNRFMLTYALKGTICATGL